MTQGDMSIKSKKFQGYAVRGLEGIQVLLWVALTFSSQLKE